MSFVFKNESGQTEFGYVYVYDQINTLLNFTQLICLLTKYFPLEYKFLVYQDKLDVVFTNELLPSQKQKLDNIITNYSLKPQTFMNILTNQVKIKSKVYVPVCNFIFPGTDLLIVEKIQLYAYLSGKNTGTYDIRCIDVLTNKTIFELCSFKKTDPEIVEAVGVSQHIRNKQTLCEIQCRVTNNSDECIVLCAQVVAFYE